MEIHYDVITQLKNTCNCWKTKIDDLNISNNGLAVLWTYGFLKHLAASGGEAVLYINIHVAKNN